MWDRKRDTDIVSLIHSSKALKIVNNLILVDLGGNLRERRKRNLTEHLPCSKAVLDALSVEAHVIFMMNIWGRFPVYRKRHHMALLRFMRLSDIILSLLNVVFSASPWRRFGPTCDFMKSPCGSLLKTSCTQRVFCVAEDETSYSVSKTVQ